MSRGWIVAAVGLLTVVVTVTAQTGAFVAVSADRPVTVNEVGDDEAYLGIDRTSVTVDGNTSDGEALATFTNRFARSVDVEVAVDDPDGYPVLEDVDGPGTLGVGDAGTLTADVRCDNSTAAQSITLDIEADGGNGLEFEATRTVAVECV
ncbi:hypothetical protein [Halobaculum sp. EA56]|uniref:hypothetical protein n=1 Tax=Halobaculum sp. EA56 TaxID=3421648 RepID=UPI003EBB2AFC